jgi:hypothetical protein
MTKRNKPLQIKITAQNGTPVAAGDRAQRHQIWLDYCNQLEQELGLCKPENVQVYQERLEAFDKTLGFPLDLTVQWPTSYAAFKQLCDRLGSDVLAVEVDRNSKSLIGVVYVADK